MVCIFLFFFFNLNCECKSFRIEIANILSALFLIYIRMILKKEVFWLKIFCVLVRYAFVYSFVLSCIHNIFRFNTSGEKSKKKKSRLNILHDTAKNLLVTKPVLMTAIRVQQYVQFCRLLFFPPISACS